MYFFLLAKADISESLIKTEEAIARQVEYQTPDMKREAAKQVVETDDDMPARLEQPRHRLESAKGIAGVVQHAAANHHIENLFPERRPKQIHGCKGHVVRSRLGPKRLRQLERVITHIDSKDRLVPRGPQVIRELPRAAPDFKNPCPRCDLLK